jgi:hypothetical protein
MEQWWNSVHFVGYFYYLLLYFLCETKEIRYCPFLLTVSEGRQILLPISRKLKRRILVIFNALTSPVTSYHTD